jgi:peptidoglycan/LPS O-acetylase OafA/YrhL
MSAPAESGLRPEVPGASDSGIAPAAEGGGAVRRAGARLAWLDALRGFAALCVVFDHATYHLLAGVRADVYEWFDPGQYGVFVFFLVSGYIVPASLERKGSMRGFWVGRLFRLYPMYLLAIVVALLVGTHGLGDPEGALGTFRVVTYDPVTSIAAWLAMVPDLLVPQINLPDVTWTLAFEMVFYILVAALYSWKAHRPVGAYAVGLAAGGVALGGVIPLEGLYHLLERHGQGQGGFIALSITADVLIIGGVVLAAVKSGRGGSVSLAGKIGITVAAVTVLVLLFSNETYPFSFSGFVILALMFTGTAIYRAEQGQTRKWQAWAVTLAVLILATLAGIMYGPAQHQGPDFVREWVTTVVAAGLTFGVGLAVRHWRLPSWLAWLGLVSYSVYLLHPLAIDTYDHFARGRTIGGDGIQLFIALGIVVLILVASAFAYYFVEKPMVALGRRVTKRVGG